jgi:glutamate N-acetyltransferase/amino-acid N-acetyltransferase
MSWLPSGFRAAGTTAGLKDSGLPDLALVVNDGPQRAAAGVFTANRVKAAPVLWSQQVLSAGQVDAVVLNSGGANACTGPAGFQDTHRTPRPSPSARHRRRARSRSAPPGLIGVRLPMDRLLPGVAKAAARSTPTAGRRRARRS